MNLFTYTLSFIFIWNVLILFELNVIIIVRKKKNCTMTTKVQILHLVLYN